MRIQGQLVDILTAIYQELYVNSAVFEYEKKTLYVKVPKAIYGILVSSILF